MTRKRTLAKVAAIGGVIATAALLMGLSAASADELADLRANQELLQRRLDQLSQAPAAPAGTGYGIPGAYGTAPAPGVPMAGGSFPRSFLIPGTDTSIRVGGFVDETIDYWLQNGPPTGQTSTTLGATGNLATQNLDVHGQTVPGLNGNANGAVPVQIGHSRGNGVFYQSPRESRLNVETRTPTAWGESRTFLEFDFAGSNNFNTGTGSGGTANTTMGTSDGLIPRLRYAYGTLGGFLAGQANSNFSDPDANAETLDFGGPIGQAGVTRIPQVRYTIAGPWGSAWSAAAEAPRTDFFTPAGLVSSDGNIASTTQANNPGPQFVPATTCVANGSIISTTVNAGTGSACTLGTNPGRAAAPDLTFASYWAQPWGHFNFRGLVRPTLDISDGAFLSRNFVGYGGGISGDVKPGWLGWAKDDFQFQASAGNGIGRYLNDNANGALATNFFGTTACATPRPGCTGTAAASNILVKPISEFGLQLGYQHWWLPNLRSNVAYGFVYYDVPSTVIGPAASVAVNKQLQTAHVNLIWNPVSFIDTGIEYYWGQRKVLANIYGTQQALIGKFRVKF
jgi:Porin subfamily/DcaP outer membrane protein